jgi:hypothetical protein
MKEKKMSEIKCNVCNESVLDEMYKCDYCGYYFCVHHIESLNDGDIYGCSNCLSKYEKYDCDKCETSYDDCPFGKEYSYCYDCEEYSEKGENE